MRTAILKRLDALEASLSQKTRQPIALIDVDGMDPADRDAYFDGDDSVLARYGYDPDDPSPGIRAIIISVHPDHRESEDLRDLDDEEFERVERQREREDRRREAEARERAQIRAIEAAQADQPQLPPAPGNAYSPMRDRD